MQNLIIKSSPRLYASGERPDVLGHTHYERELSEKELEAILKDHNKMERLRRNPDERAMEAVHTWMQWNLPHGDTVKWGSDTPVTLTISELEEMAKKLVNEVLA